ncbi:ankyrin-1, partial [Lindgomyces ingoldianus]
MEPAGLAVGTIALVSLFSTCLEALEKLDNYKNFQIDSHHLAAQFEVDKLRFEKWGLAVGTAKFLWINGPAGFGKTILCARVIEHLSCTLKEPLAHFFFSSDFDSHGDLYVAVRSWIFQLISHQRAFEVVYEKWGAQYGQKATRATIVKIFREITQAIPKCTFILDGLDECIWIGENQKYGYPNSVAEFLETIRQAVADTTTRIMIVSRIEPQIRQGFWNYTSENFFEYNISIEDVQPDTVAYSRSIVNRKLFKKNETTKDDISQKMADRCNGQFLWLRMQEDSLDGWMNKKQLEDTIGGTPIGLEQLYDRTWSQISHFPDWKKGRAVSILRWAAFALQPLTVCEIAEALLVHDDYDDLPIEEMPDSIDEDYINSGILGLCGSLLEVRGTLSEPHLGLRTVHLTHFTVKEFLIIQLPIQGGSIGANRRLSTSVEAVQGSILAKTCLRYINFPRVWQLAPHV